MRSAILVWEDECDTHSEDLLDRYGFRWQYLGDLIYLFENTRQRNRALCLLRANGIEVEALSEENPLLRQRLAAVPDALGVT